MHKPESAIQLIDDQPLELEHGGELPRLEIAYETWGRLSAARDNAILVCPAFSGHAHAQSSPEDPTPGWWEGMIGSGLAFDTEHFFVVCASLLGGSFGTTGPTSIDPRTGAPYRGAFPVISVRDVVNVHVRLLDRLGIDRLFAAAGGSLGAMETLELGITHPARTARVIAISGTDYTRPYTAGIRHLGRRAIMLDPAWENGFYELAKGPAEGLRLAREVGTLYYRGREEFNARFPHQPIHSPSIRGITFDVQSYLDHQGRKAISHFDANSYLILSLAMDLHDVWRGFSSRQAALAPVEAAFQIVAVEEDRLIGVDEQRAVHRALRDAGKKSEWHQVSSRIGHDAFLVEHGMMTELIRPFLLG